MRKLNIKFWIALACLVILFGCAQTSTKSLQPYEYLTGLGYQMEQYHQKHGIYPKVLDELNATGLDKAYTCRLVKTGKDQYHLVTENSNGLRNYEMKNSFRYPMWIFTDATDREESKKALLDNLDKDPAKYIPELRNFPDDDIKKYLITLIKEKRGNDFLASEVLYQLATNEDQYLITDLIEIVAKKDRNDEILGNLSKIMTGITGDVSVYYETDWDEITKQDYDTCYGKLFDVEEKALADKVNMRKYQYCPVSKK